MSSIEKVKEIALRHEFEEISIGRWERPTRFGSPKRFGTKTAANIIITFNEDKVSIQLEGEAKFGDVDIMINNIDVDYFVSRIRELEMKLAYSWAELN